MTRRFRSRAMRLSFALSMLVAIGAHAGGATRLDQQDIDTLRSDIRAMTEGFARGDAEPVIVRTHPSLKTMVGGPEAFAALTRDAIVQLRATGIVFVSQEIGEPTQVYPAGDQEICFVPRFSVMEMNGRQMRSVSYMVAIRVKGGAHWTYLDGAGLRKNPGMLHHLLPGLAREVPLPPNTLEE